MVSIDHKEKWILHVTDGTMDKVKTRILQYYRLGENICHVYKHQNISTQKSYLEFLKSACGDGRVAYQLELN